MKSIRKRKPYNYVNSGFRRYLLHLVKNLNYSIKDAAAALNINYSTAKTIIQVYKRSGRIDKVDKHSEITQSLQLANQQLINNNTLHNEEIFQHDSCISSSNSLKSVSLEDYPQNQQQQIPGSRLSVLNNENQLAKNRPIIFQ